MPLPDGFEFEAIKPTLSNAKTMLRLTFEDLRENGFRQPLKLVDPNSLAKIKVQRDKLESHPEHYCGVIHNGQLVGFTKETDWLSDDERPFVNVLCALWLKARRRVFRRSHLPGYPWGIFGLVVSEDLDPAVRAEIFVALLERSLENNGQTRTVNIVTTHVYYMVPWVLQDLGFVQVGKPGKAAGAGDIKQWRYQRPATPATDG